MWSLLCQQSLAGLWPPLEVRIVMSKNPAWPGRGRAGSSCSVAINSLTSCLWFFLLFSGFSA